MGNGALPNGPSYRAHPRLYHYISIESLEGNRFAIGNLLGKALLLDDDVRSGIKLPDGPLKKLSEAKRLTGEHKFGKTFNFTNRAVPVLLCNGIPSLADLSYGMLRRLMVIPFERTFTPEEDDITRFDKIWASELPGVLNRAISRLERVIARDNRFKYPESVKRATAEFIRHANPLPAFIADRCERDPKVRCLMREFYGEYGRWAEEQGMTMTQQQSTVRRNLGHLGFLVKHGNRGDTVYGLRLKSSSEQA
jgi:putative DNA primase/helicase